MTDPSQLVDVAPRSAGPRQAEQYSTTLYMTSRADGYT